uniref:CSON009161 protein n=1 Tax=Culicoides sonorensis TaxID=179676 RepID=A0A336LK65_CULSO
MAEEAPVETPVDAPAGEAAGDQPLQHSEDGGVTSPTDWKATEGRLFRHWVRPKFSQYRYLDDYRYNYYDDVLDYLDKRQKGISRDIPRPEYWAERVIRTNRKYDHMESEKLQQSYQSVSARETKRLTRTLTSINSTVSHSQLRNTGSRSYLLSSRYSTLL